MNTAEVVIIGGGVIGCSTAYHLARLGCRDVAVLEKDTLGSGSTGKCPGGIRQQFSTELNIRLAMESVKFFERFEELTGSPADFRQNGYLILATSPEEMAAFRNNVALQTSLGVKVYLLSPQEAKEFVPWLNVDDVPGATFCPADGYATPHSVVQGFASAARKLGARILEETEVTGLEVVGDKIKGVLTSKSRIDAPVLVNAAGAYAGLVGKMVNIDIPIRPSRRHVFVTEPLPTTIRKAAHWAKLPMVVDFHNGFWFRREGATLIFGMRNPEESESFNTSVDWGYLANSLGAVASRRLPFLTDTGIMNGQAGLHEDTPDNNAIMGKVPDVEGLYLACGCSGHGFMHSPAVGRLMAELILKGKTSPDISSLGLARFKTEAHQKEKCFI